MNIVFIVHSDLHNKDCLGVIEPCGDGTCCVYAENLPGVTSCGNTIEEARDNLLLAFNEVLDEYKERGIEPPFEDS